MQLVIEITKEHYEEMIRKSKKSIGYCTMIARGIPLPEKHGRLIDADSQDDVISRLNENGWEITRADYKLIDNVLFEFPTIIEATEG